MPNYYEILGVPHNATEDEIRKAYRRLALRFHPDKNRDDSTDEATRKFREISEAYEILSDTQKRRQYDMQFMDSGHQRFSIGVFQFRDPFDIFQEFFDIPELFEYGRNSSFMDGSFLTRMASDNPRNSVPDIEFPNVHREFHYHRSSVTRSVSNGIATETRISQLDGQEIVEHYENGILKSRIVNGILQALPSTSQNY